MADLFNIQALISENRVTKVIDVDPNNTYVQIGVFQEGNRKSGSSNANAYPSYVMSLSEFLATGAGHIIEYNGVPLPQRPTLDFTGAGVSVTDVGGKTVVTIAGAAGGSSLPIVRYVYLVQDASDAVLMGGASSNVYTTAQAAYNAAVALRATLGGTQRVIISVGNTDATVVGGITLTANWDQYITLVGKGPYTSEIGDIIATNAAGSGYNVGSAVGTNLTTISQIKIGNITTSATGVTGNSGTIGLRLDNVIAGDLNTNVTDGANPGSGGNIRINTLAVAKTSFNVGNIITTAPIGNSGSVNLVNNFGLCTVGNITANAQINLFALTARAGAITMTSTGNTSVFLTNVTATAALNFTSNAGDITLTNCVLSTVNINATTGVQSTATINNCSIPVINCSTNLDFQIIAKNSLIGSIQYMGKDSTISACVIDFAQASGLNPINVFGTNCVIYNSTLIGSVSSGVKAILNTAGNHTIIISDTTLIGGLGSTVSAINDSLTPVISSDGFGNFSIDASIYSTVLISLTGENGGSNALSFSKAIFNKTLRVIVDNSTTGTDTLSLSGLFVAGGGTYVPSASGWPDVLTIFFDDQGNGFVYPTYDYQQQP